MSFNLLENNKTIKNLSEQRVFHCPGHDLTHNAYHLRPINTHILSFAIAHMKESILASLTNFKLLSFCYQLITFLTEHLMKKLFFFYNVLHLQYLLFLSLIFVLNLVELLLAQRTFINVFCAPFFYALETEFVGAALDGSLIYFFHFIQADYAGLFLFVLTHFFKGFTILLNTFSYNH